MFNCSAKKESGFDPYSFFNRLYFHARFTLSIGICNKFNFDSVLSAYAADIVDTEGAVGIDATAMDANTHIIYLVNEDGSNTLYLFSEPMAH